MGLYELTILQYVILLQYIAVLQYYYDITMHVQCNTIFNKTSFKITLSKINLYQDRKFPAGKSYGNTIVALFISMAYLGVFLR